MFYCQRTIAWHHTQCWSMNMNSAKKKFKKISNITINQSVIFYFSLWKVNPHRVQSFYIFNSVSHRLHPELVRNILAFGNHKSLVAKSDPKEGTWNFGQGPWQQAVTVRPLLGSELARVIVESLFSCQRDTVLMIFT